MIYIIDETTNIVNEKFIAASLSYPDCALYCASDETKSVYIWKAGTENPILTLKEHSTAATSMLLYSEESTLYSGLRGGMIVIWDLNRTKVKLNLQGHGNAITAMSIYDIENSPRVLASASIEGKLKLWDLKSNNQAISFKGHFEQINTLAFSPDLSYLASGSVDGLVRIWDIRTNKMMKEFSAPDQRAVNCIEFHPNMNTFAYGSKDKTIRYWDLEKYSMLSFTPLDRLPIENIAFEKNGKGLFSATNEALKYWTIEDNELRSYEMFETGWNKLQSFRVIDKKAVFGLSSFSKKISYYAISYDMIMNYKDYKHKRSNSAMKSIAEELFDNSKDYYNIININANTTINQNKNDPISAPQTKQFFDDWSNYKEMNPNSNNLNLNEISSFPDMGISQFITNHPNQSNISLSIDTSSQMIPIQKMIQTQTINQSINQSPGQNQAKSNNVLINNAMNIMKSVPVKDSPKPHNNKAQEIKSPQMIFENILSNPNNILPPNKIDTFESNMNLSLIQTKEEINDTLLEDDPLFEIDNLIKKVDSNNNFNGTNASFMSVNSSDTMGIDFNQFDKQTKPMNDTVHAISKAEDLPIIQEINNQHTIIRNNLTTRFNSMSMMAKWWSSSDIGSTLNGLDTLKDTGVTNDFFKYALIARGDLSKIPFTLDHSVELLGHVIKLIDSQYYCGTGCKVGMLLIKILNDKVSRVKQSYNASSKDQMDFFIDERAGKCDMIIEKFKQIYQSKKLEELRNSTNNKKRELAIKLHTDLEFFLKPYQNNKKI